MDAAIAADEANGIYRAGRAAETAPVPDARLAPVLEGLLGIHRIAAEPEQPAA